MLELRDVSHSYGRTPTLDKVSMALDEGDIACILGPSGCGKTTLLRCVAGFERLSDGSIAVNGQTISSTTNHVTAENRRIGMVFQDNALLPHLTVLGNVMFGLHDKSRDDAKGIAKRMLQQVGLAKFAARYPHELSGGQQQRVAIARALAPGTELLLMDEPFSNLDASMRSGLGREIKSLLNSFGATALVATHDHQDAFALGDMLGVMNDGKLLQWDTSYNIYHQPKDHFVADFIGRGVWLPGRVTGKNEVEIEVGIARGTMTTSYPVGTEVEMFLRPDDIVHDDASKLQVEVTGKRFRGTDFLYELRLPGGTLILSSVPSHHDHAVGEKIGIHLHTDHMVVFPRN
jgi:iron(III) transport system ATP-binding protein